MQAVLTIYDLPVDGLSASRVFHDQHFKDAAALLDQDHHDALAIIMPVAGPDHDDWRRTLARDLARAFTPKRVNVVGASGGASCDDILGYLEDAPGVTGQYLASHE